MAAVVSVGYDMSGPLTKALFGWAWERSKRRHMAIAVYRCAAAAAYRRVQDVTPSLGEHWDLASAIDMTSKTIRYMIDTKRDEARVQALMESAGALSAFAMASQPFDDWLCGRNVVAEVVDVWRVWRER